MRRGVLLCHCYEFVSREMQVKQSLLVRDGGKLILIEMNYKKGESGRGDLPAHCYEVKHSLFVWLEIEARLIIIKFNYLLFLNVLGAKGKIVF